jgi:hypothetical protein
MKVNIKSYIMKFLPCVPYSARYRFSITTIVTIIIKNEEVERLQKNRKSEHL